MHDSGASDMRYRMLVAAVPAFISIYFLVAGLQPLLHLGAGSEKYLFYHWYVFTYVPSREEITYDAVVTERGGKPVDPVALVDSGNFLFDAWRNRPYYTERIRQLGEAVASQSEHVGANRKTIEQYVIAGPVTYEVREIRYDPIRRYLAGEIHSSRTIGTFEAN